MKYYILRNKAMPWGSYGEILWQGIYHFSKSTQEHLIMRTGPFCPPIYRSQYDRQIPVLIMTHKISRQISDNNFSGLTIEPVVKEKIVKLNWETWDLTAPEPQIYPSGDMDAEEYIISRKHNEITSSQMSELYVMIPQKDGLLYKEISELNKGFKLLPSSLSGLDFFVDRLYCNWFSEIYVSQRAKKILESELGEYLYFESVEMYDTDIKTAEKLENEAIHKENKFKQEFAMTDNDWRKWHHLRNAARKLIEGIGELKSVKAQEKRAESIKEKLIQANDIYQMSYEKWMDNYWHK